MMGYNKPSKKILKQSIGEEFLPIETSMFGPEYKGDGTYCIVGPDPYIRKWFAEVKVVDGKIARVK